MDRLTSVTLGDVTAGLRRYWPAAVTVALIVVMAAWLPGDRPGLPAGFLGASAPPPVQVAAGASSDAAVSDATTSTSSPFGSGSDGTASFDSGSGFALGPSSSFGGSSATTFHGDEDAAAPDAALVTSPSAGGSGSGSEPPPLRVTASSYATNGPGTPLATQDVADGSLPVGKRLGQEDKRSYVRLSGSGTELRFTEATGGRSTGGSVVSVQACRVTQGGWGEGRGVAFSAAPPFDAASCVKGVRATNAEWSFDLSAFADRTDDKGFALVFAPDAGVDFQVNLKPVIL